MIDIPLTDSMRDDVSSMIADLMELQTRGTFKIYGIPANTQAFAAIFSLRCAIGNLIDEDDEMEEELRGTIEEEAADECGFDLNE